MGEEQSLNRLRWLRRARRWLLRVGTCSLIGVIAVHGLQLLSMEIWLRSILVFLRRALLYVTRKFLT